MRGHTSSVSSLVRYLLIVVLFLFSAGLSLAQTAVPVADKTKADPSLIAPASETLATNAQTGNIGSGTNSTTTELDSVRAAAVLMNAAPDESPQGQPKVSPQDPSLAAAPLQGAQCKRTIKADVLALAQPIMLNRLGAAIPDGKIFVLRRDTKQLPNGLFQLRVGKRARPLVLRANVGDCMAITLTNVIPAAEFTAPQTKAAGAPNFPYTLPAGSTPEVSLHVQGLEWVQGSQDDGSFVGKNNSSLVDPGLANSKTYKLFARQEGTFLLYTLGDSTSTGNQLTEGLFGAVNVQPAGAEWYRSQVSQQDLKLATTGSTADGHPIINYDATYSPGSTYADGTPIPADTPILKMLDKNLNIVHTDLTAMITGPKHGRFTQPELDCDAAAAITPAGVDPLFCKNPASPDRRQPYREFTIIYHGGLTPVATQAFPVFTDPTMQNMLVAGQDAFAINYGTGGIGAEVYANRIGVGPMGDCVDCKFEEFFLSAWSVGDPAMLVDRPANTNIKPPLPATPAAPQVPPPPPLCTAAQLGDTNPPTAPDKNCVNARQPTGSPLAGTVTFVNGSAIVNGVGTSFQTQLAVGDELVLASSPATIRGTVKTITNNAKLVLQANAAASANGAYSSANPYKLVPLPKATIAYYPDDPSNVYHSYINDHLKFRILHGGRDVTHVHHQHAHQWLQSPNSDQSSYLDSQMISPGASYTLEMVYNGSGNRNKVVGDSIFHCHFYPHFAAGMWAMWRTHDVFESGTVLKAGIPVPDARALPDGEIKAGTPIPALVPLPTIPMAPLPSDVYIKNGQVFYGKPTDPVDPADPTGEKKVKENPGFPFFIPGVAGARAPHPPLDFAKDGPVVLDGGLPRHVVTGGTVSYESHDTLDWSKDLATVNAIKLPEEGTNVEQVAMKYFGVRCYPSFFPDGSAGSCPSSNSTSPQSTLNTPPKGFVLNGLPRKNPAGNSAEQLGATSGAPFADPAIDDNGNPVGTLRRYKAAAIQLDVTFNKKGWHYPQQRMLTLWEDASKTLKYNPSAPTTPDTRQPEPLFFRGNSGDIIEYWHTNLVPNYYMVDDFQVRTPTDILGQHIHLVKFDVTSSDGAGNGFNYEDGTFAPEEVQELIKAINESPTKGFVNEPNQLLKATMPPKDIVDCVNDPTNIRCQPCPHNWTPTSRPQCASWMGAQTTIQRWYIDPLVDDQNEDRTLRTVFTHDHFGPSTHQQAGLYAGLLVEPMGSKWTSNDGVDMATRSDGGPTSWQARIITAKPEDSYREFMLEFQDLQLAYWTNYPPIKTAPSADPKVGWIDPKNAINPPGSATQARPSLITTGINITPAGTQSVNYLNEPIATRLGSSVAFPPPSKSSDLSFVFDNTIQSTVNPLYKPDPMTPLMRAYQNDKVQLRMLVGAHVFSHQFNLFGPTWFAEPSWENSGYRSAQAAGLSEHFELMFKVPSSSAPSTPRKCPDDMSYVNCVDYLYSPSFDESGLANGLWGLFRAYDPTAKTDDPILKTVVPLPNNPIGPGTSVTYATCPASLQAPAIKRTFNITAVTSQQVLASQSPFPKSIVFNGRGDPSKALANWQGIMYVRSEDLITDPANPKKGQLKPGVPVEPLILRANAGDCIEVNLTNALPPGSDVFKANFQLAPPLTNPPYPTKVSSFVGLRPQLLSYDAAKSTGINIGWNAQGQPDQVVPFGQTVKYQWYAGKIDRKGAGLTYTPIEFGALNLFPSDTMFQNINGLFGSMIIEPAGSTWQCGEVGSLANCDPSAAPPATTRASATVSAPDNTQFREFALMISDSIQVKPGVSGSAVNYRTEPWSFRYANNNTPDFSCMLSNQLVNIPPTPSTPVGDPKTPIFGANAWNQVRFRMAHPFGTGTSQVFTVNGHVWQRNPYNTSSTRIGNNKLSQWIGSRDNHGSSDHFDLLIDKAGGEGALGGDYLYSVFQFLQVNQGAWGIFRVNGKGQLAPATATPAACKEPTPKPGYKPTPAPAGKDGLMIRRPLNGK